MDFSACILYIICTPAEAFTDSKKLAIMISGLIKYKQLTMLVLITVAQAYLRKQTCLTIYRQNMLNG